LPRSNHSATVFGDDLNSIFFFGGTSLHSFLDDSLVLAGIGTDKPRWVPIYTARNPNGRRGHSMAVKTHHPNEFLLFGGQRGNLVLNDLWSFDAQANAWTELRCAGTLPPPRAFHTSYVVNNHLCVFGGMDAIGIIKETEVCCFIFYLSPDKSFFFYFLVFTIFVQVFTSIYDSREGRWTKRAIQDANLSGGT
jgi:hypothetical protein